ncbi:MAG: hypothetical protein RLZZ436_3207, partial [Planctomycetota bacterium]
MNSASEKSASVPSRRRVVRAFATAVAAGGVSYAAQQG